MCVESLPSIELNQANPLQDLLRVSLEQRTAVGLSILYLGSQPHAAIGDLDTGATRPEHDAHEDKLYWEANEKDLI